MFKVKQFLVKIIFFLFYTILFIMIIIGLTSCTNYTQIQLALNRNLKLWDSHNIQNYSYTYIESGFDSSIIYSDTISNNIVYSVNIDDTEYILTNQNEIKSNHLYPYNGFLTIVDIFNSIQTFIDDSLTGSFIDRRNEKILIEYDSLYGYPKKISTQKRLTRDGQSSTSVKDFNID